MTELAPGQCKIAMGHAGDGNLHVAVRPHSRDIAENPEIVLEMDKTISGLAVEMGGSFSAEHGIGFEKVKTLRTLKDPVSYSVMKAIKQCLDPEMIMNPGKVFE